jgi:hypothetical protein
MRVVQVTITMLPDGTLALERMHNGARIQTPVFDFETIRRALAAQLHNRADTIGTDGKPTVSQVTHWEQHLERVDHRTGAVLSIGKLSPDTCVWCLAHTMGLSTDQKAHNRARAMLKEQRRIASSPFKMGNGSVTVRRVPKGASSKSKKPITETLVMDFDEDFFQEEA